VSFCCGGGRYLRHAGYKLRCHAEEDSSLYRLDASFYLLEDGLGCGGATVCFLSLNYARHYVSHRGFVLQIAVAEDSRLHRQDASFTVDTAAAVAAGGEREAVGAAGGAALVPLGGAVSKLPPCAGSGGLVSLRSHNYPAHVWRVLDPQTVRICEGGGLGLAADSFTIVPGL
jgi:hypothetical protein